MEKYILITLFFLSDISYSQIEIRENVRNEPYDNSTIVVYDSINDFKKLENAVDYLQYIGQELFLPPKYNNNLLLDRLKSTYGSLHVEAYQRTNNLTIDIDNANLIFNSKYKILNVTSDLKNLREISPQKDFQGILKFILKDSLNNEIVLTKNLGFGDKSLFPFILQGFYEKSIKEYRNQELFVFKEVENIRGERNKFIDINSGETIILEEGTFWNCVSVSFIKLGYFESYSPFFILKNEKNEIKIELGELFRNGLISLKELQLLSELWKTNQKKNQNISNIQNKKIKDECNRKFGSSICNKLLQGKIEIGMTKDMITFIYGEPFETYFVKNKDGLIEILLYGDTMFYFNNKHLITIKGYK